MRRRRRPDRWTETPSCSEFRTSDWRKWGSGSRVLDSRMFGRTKAVRLTRYPEWRGAPPGGEGEAKPPGAAPGKGRGARARGGGGEGGVRPPTRGGGGRG